MTTAGLFLMALGVLWMVAAAALRGEYTRVDMCLFSAAWLGGIGLVVASIALTSVPA